MINSEFSFDDIGTDIDFYIVLQNPEEGDEDHFFTPTNGDVKEALKRVLLETRRLLASNEDGYRQYEYAEKYSSLECLWKPLTTTELLKIREIYNTANLPEYTNIDEAAENIVYYYASFVDGNGKKVVGVKRASFFKGLLKAKGSLLKIFNNTLSIIDDAVFKLDKDFDFLICEENVFILRPAGFIYLAEIDEVLQSVARERTIQLDNRIDFIDFDAMLDYVCSHTQAARLISAISSNNEVESFQRENIVALAASTGVSIIENDDKITPERGHELNFLKLLDYRIYTVSLTSEAEACMANSRRRLSV